MAPSEMARTFNLGLGMALVVSGEEAEGVCSSLKKAGMRSWVVGKLMLSDGTDGRCSLENESIFDR